MPAAASTPASTPAPASVSAAVLKAALSAEPAHGAALFSARFKSIPADFQVAEKLPFEFSGQGEHLYLRLEKTERNTSDVIKALRRCFKVSKKDVGVAGLKDRQAVTNQWFSVHTPADEAPLTRWLESDDAPPFRLLESARHSKKLRTGAHSANEFVITLKDVVMLDSDKEAINARVQSLVARGFPNYFGPQRFGRNGSNLTSAVHWLTHQERIPSLAREKRSMYLSAVRSAAFNRVLSARVARGNWNQLRRGELCVLHGTNSVFTPTEAEHEATVTRLNEFDVHPSAPLIGKGALLCEHDALADDEAVLAEDPKNTALVTALTHLRVDASNRATRALCQDLNHTWVDDQTLEISVTLAPGVFATTLLNELFMERSA